MRTIIIILLLSSSLMGVGVVVVVEQENPIEVFKKQRVTQGDIFFSQAQNFFNDKLYTSCIEKILDYLVLFPSHPSTVKAQKLLSSAYQFNDQWGKSIEVDLKIYRENPTIEDGLTSYLDAARKLSRIGQISKAKPMLENLKTQMFSVKVAKDAEIELNQWKILEMEAMPVENSISK
jgi:hypothetical protein